MFDIYSLIILKMATVINFQIQFILLNLNYLQIDESILEMVIYKVRSFLILPKIILSIIILI